MSNLIFGTIYALSEVEKGRSIRNALKEAIRKNQITREEESNIYFSVFETYRRLNVIDLYIKLSSSNFALKNLKNETKALLRFATHQLKFQKIPLNEVLDVITYNFKPFNSGPQISKVVMSNTISPVSSSPSPRLKRM